MRHDLRPHATDTAAALRAAGLEWNVDAVPVFLQDGRPTGSRAGIRSDNGAIVARSLGPKYSILQNRDLAATIDPLVSSGLVSLVGGGSFKGGAIVFLQAEINGAVDVIARGDEVRSSIAMTNFHDGGGGASMLSTDTCIACQNTLRAALDGARADGQIKTARHTGDVRGKVDAFRDEIALQVAAFRARCNEWRAMNATPIRSDEELNAYFLQVATGGKSGAVALPAHGDDDDTAPAGRTVKALQEAFNAPIALNGYRPSTWWAAFQAVTQWTTHARGRSDDSRLESAWFGDSARRVDFAHKAALRFATGNR